VQAQKKVPQTDAIFTRLKEVNSATDVSEERLRLCLDAKATVKIGLLSRDGRSWADIKAADHDFKPDAILTPVGILVPRYNDLFLYFARSRMTSDFLADVLDLWWTRFRGCFPKVRTLVLNQDNGPENHSRRTQFMKRMVQFVQEHRVTVELAYYPPYHSKYNGIERCWGALENHWNGSLLDAIPTALRFAETMTWHGMHPVVTLLTKTYQKGVRLTAAEMNELETQIQRFPGLAKWFVTIPYPQP
jgi:hypothetical protein